MSQQIENKKSPRPHPRFITKLMQFDPESKKMVSPVSMTDQSFKKETDINRIIRKGLVGLDSSDFVFADVSAFPDFQEQRDAIASVHEQFDRLPSELRRKFENDPANLIDFMSNPENEEASIELGLRPKPQKNGSQAPDGDTKPPKPVSEPKPDTSKSDSKKDPSLSTVDS